MNRITIEEEVKGKGMFNIIDHRTGFKLDFIIRKESEYYRIRGRIRAANPEISEAELNVELFRTFYRSDFDEQTMLRILNSMREYHRSEDSTDGKSENQES